MADTREELWKAVVLVKLQTNRGLYDAVEAADMVLREFDERFAEPLLRTSTAEPPVADAAPTDIPGGLIPPAEQLNRGFRSCI